MDRLTRLYVTKFESRKTPATRNDDDAMKVDSRFTKGAKETN